MLRARSRHSCPGARCVHLARRAAPTRWPPSPSTTINRVTNCLFCLLFCPPAWEPPLRSHALNPNSFSADLCHATRAGRRFSGTPAPFSLSLSLSAAAVALTSGRRPCTLWGRASRPQPPNPRLVFSFWTRVKWDGHHSAPAPAALFFPLFYSSAETKCQLS